MQIKRLRNTHFGTKKISRVVTGWALYEPGKGWVAFSADRDEFGILVPYIPCGGKRALQSILDAGGFCSFEGMEYVQELAAQAAGSGKGQRWQAEIINITSQTTKTSKTITGIVL